MRIEDIDCSFPATLMEVLELQADETTRGRLLAGGTDLMAQWESGIVAPPEKATSLLAIPELKEIREDGDAVVIGAAVTHTEIRHSSLAQAHLPALVAAAETVGGRQIQSRGTIGGNVANASPAGDLPPALLITDGQVVVASVSGERSIPLVDFFQDYRKIDLRPEELIVRFVLPKLPEGSRESFRKLGQRAAQAISKVMGGYRVRVKDGVIESIAISLGSVAATVIRLPEVERWLKGKALNENTFAVAEQMTLKIVTPIDDIRSTAEYRKWVSGRLVRGFLEALAES